MVYKDYEPGETTKTVNYNGQSITFNKKGTTKTLEKPIHPHPDHVLHGARHVGV